MVSPLQVILIILFLLVMGMMGSGTQIFAYAANVFIGWVIGLIMGDGKTGMYVGAVMTLMSLGVGPFGGSSVPDYKLGTIIGVIFAITTGEGVEAALTVGVPMAALGTELDVLMKTLGSVLIHDEIRLSDAHEFEKMRRDVVLGLLFWSLKTIIPVFLLVTVGAEFVTNLVQSMPVWLNKGMTTVAGMLPAVGFAMLLKYMPVQKYGIYAVMGFVLAAYFNQAMLPIALIATVFAVNEYRRLEDHDRLASATAAAPVAAESNIVTSEPTPEQLESGDYDE